MKTKIKIFLFFVCLGCFFMPAAYCSDIDYIEERQELPDTSYMSDFLKQIFTIQFATGVIASCIAAFIIWICKVMIVDRFRYKSPYSGIWEEVAYNDDGSVRKKFLLSIKHNRRTHELKGKCTKTSPEINRYSINKIIGVISNNNLIYIVDVNAPAYVRGAVNAVLKENNCFKGYYLTYDGEELKNIRVEIKRPQNISEAKKLLCKAKIAKLLRR